MYRKTKALLVLLSAFISVEGSVDKARVAVLTDANFGASTSNGTWLVSFYAPWCGHCRKLEPVLEEVAPLVADKLHVGTVDATVQKQLAQQHKIESYPTIKVRRNGAEDLFDYEGPRTKESFIAFAERLAGKTPLTLKTPAEVDAFRKKHDVAFVLALGSKPPLDLRNAFEEVADQLKHVAYFATAIPAALKASPFGKDGATVLAKSEGPGAQQFVLHPSPKSLGVRDLHKWVLGNSLPLVSNLDNHNFRKLANQGKMLAIGVVDPDDQQRTDLFVEGLKDVAVHQRQIISEKFLLSTLDGKKFATFVRQFNIKPEELPRLFVLDYPKQTFYEEPEIDEPDEVEVFLQNVASGKVPAQSRGPLQVGKKALDKLKAHYPYSLALPAAIAILLISFCFWQSGNQDDTHVEKQGNADDTAPGSSAAAEGQPLEQVTSALGGETQEQQPLEDKKNI